MVQNSNINSIDQNNPENSDIIQLNADSSHKINMPEGHFVGDANLSRDGQDLVLDFSDGEKFSVENYFSDQHDFLIQDSAGGILTEGLANSFIQSSPDYAQNSSLTDESPVGAVEEIKGDATVTRLDGSTDNITLGTPIYQGDIIQTSGDGAVNITFIDETSMAISDNARIAVDNYSYDPATESGETDFSVLRGVFVYTSGLIGRDDPDDVEINTPVGSIGIRGTIIAGRINPKGESEVSVLEGAIVIKNGFGETTLSQQYETVKLSGFQDTIEYKGVESANDIGNTYGSVSDVLPGLFSSIDDAQKEEVISQKAEQKAEEEIEAAEEIIEEQNENVQEAIVDPEFEVQNGDINFIEQHNLNDTSLYQNRLNHIKSLRYDDREINNIEDKDNSQRFVINNDTEETPNIVTDNSTADANGDPGKIEASDDGQWLVGDFDFHDGNKEDIRMSGGQGNNIFKINNDQFDLINGGDGFDTIKFLPGGGSLDFSGINPGQIQRIEALEFGGTSQTITLTAENIFNILQSSDTGVLKIDGNIASNLSIKNNGTPTGGGQTEILSALNNDINVGSTITHATTGSYDHYSIGIYNLYVDSDITTAVV